MCDSLCNTPQATQVGFEPTTQHSRADVLTSSPPQQQHASSKKAIHLRNGVSFDHESPPQETAQVSHVFEHVKAMCAGPTGSKHVRDLQSLLMMSPSDMLLLDLFSI